MKRLLTILIAALAVQALSAQELRFDSNGTFKIAQFTDIHLTPGNTDSEVRVPQMITKVVEAERPDLLVFTGDIVTAKPAMPGWEFIADMCAKIGVPYAVTMGNHDPEMTTRDSIYTFLQTQPLFVGEKGPKELAGMGNYVLPVLASDGSDNPAGLVYCMDSNDYSPDQEKYGYYGWIEHSQIAWYRQQSDRFTTINGGKPLPAVAYFHIALPESRTAMMEKRMKDEMAKAISEGVNPREIRERIRVMSHRGGINSGLFAAFIEKQDVLGAFAGHTHELDHVNEYRGIALGYGRVSGYEAYGRNERGTRIVELHEGEYTFDTWITTPKGKEDVHSFPEHLTSVDTKDITYKPALDVEPVRNGVSYKYYTGNFQSVKDFAGMEPKEEGILNTFSILQARGRDHFGYDFSSYLEIPGDDVYHFSLVCDDGAQLFIDDELVIDRDGSHARDAAVVKIPLAKGFHKVRILYFEDYMGESLGLWMEGRKMRKTELRADMLYQIEKPGVQLRFNADGKFRIAQFTDTHLDPTRDTYRSILNMITEMIEKENPDFVIFTGDIVTTGPSDKAWGGLIETLEATGKPYGVVTGNHETEVTTRDTIFNYLLNSSLFLGKKGLRLEKKMGNYILPVLASDGSDKTKAVLYCMDSGEFGGDQELLGQYEWFDWDQINWYRNNSTAYTRKNGGKPVPSLAFFHIPVPEYRYLNGKDDVYGTYFFSGAGSAEINSGMFTSMLDMKDVMGVFVGHDHQCDNIGLMNGVALAYGRYSGASRMRMESGCRIIDLIEGEFEFETYNSTPNGKDFIYYYPSGVTSDDEQGLTYYPAKKVNPKKNGVKYTYYEGEFKNLEEVKTKGVKKDNGTMTNFIVDEAPAEDHYAYEFTSYLDIPETAVYRFFINSDDGAKLYIDGKLLIDNDGSHSAARKGQKIALNKGFHEIKIEYFEDYMGQELKVRMLSRNMPEQLIPENMLYIK